MSRYPRRIDRGAAERLLRGEPADPRHPDDLLAVLLATAAAPAHAGELAGEEAAVAAFRRARAAAALTAVPAAAQPGDARSAAAGQPALTPVPVLALAEERWEPAPARKWIRHPVRLALVALTATTAGGVALAAASVPWSQQPSDQRPAIASPSPSPSGLAGAGSGQAHGGAGAATPHPSHVGLCRAYKAGAGSAPGKALDNPAFKSLIKAAGGKDNVPAYCADVLAAAANRAKKSKSSDQAPTPSQPGEAGQSGRSGQYGPTGKPTSGRATPTAEPRGKTAPQHTKTPEARLLSAQVAGGRSAPPPWSPPAGPIE